jgi:S-adenosylmethionine-diacylgycerolhomoserine-N-methlytransferase
MRAVPAPLPGDIRARMDRMYRPQAPFYDLTRKCYLLGRDRLIAGLDARPGQVLLEVGCGTGRNLVLIGRRHPGVGLLGVDAAAPMLAAAGRALRRRGLAGRALLARGVAERLDLGELFGLTRPVDHVVISYTLSMVDDPEAALRAALGALRPGGRLHVVDFGDQAGLPAWFRRLLAAWLAGFGVRHWPEVEAALRGLAGAGPGRYEREEIAGGYALLSRFDKAA